MDYQLFIKQFKTGWSAYWRALPFIRKHQLWLGLTRAKWLIRLLLVVAALISLQFTIAFWGWIGMPSINSFKAPGINLNFDLSFSDFSTDLHKSGGLKYLIILAMHILISAFGGRTTEVLQGQPFQPTLMSYIRGKWRGLLVIIRNFFVEIALVILIALVLSLFGFSFLKNPIIFVVQSYLLGFVVLDTANSRLNMSIRQSARRIRKYAGLAVVIGLGLYVLLLIPIFGAVVAPCMAAVAAVLAMHELENVEEVNSTMAESVIEGKTEL